MKRPPLPRSVARKLRQEAGFGCVICGNPIIVYHHIIEWSEWHHFDPDHMTVLCPDHHAFATNRSLSHEQVYEAKRHPANRRLAQGAFPFVNESPRFIVGTIGVVNCREIFRIGNKWLLRMSFRPRHGLLLDAQLFTRDNQPLLRIWENEWHAFVSEAWDIIYNGKRLKVWHGPRDIGFDLTWDSEQKELTVYGKFEYEGARLVCDKSGVQVVDRSLKFTQFSVEGWLTAFFVQTAKKEPIPKGTMFAFLA